MKAPTYHELAQAYSQGAYALFVPSPLPAPGQRRLVPVDLVDQAAQLLSISSRLTAATASQLTHADVVVRAEASTRLLAKALADLEISLHLQAAAEHEGLVRGFELRPMGPPPSELRQSLTLLIGEQGVSNLGFRRGEMPPTTDPAAARQQLISKVRDTLDLVRAEAAKEGQTALAGLITLGLSEVAQAAAMVGMDIAQALGQAEKVTRLYSMVRNFAVNGYNALLALLGPTLAQIAANQVVVWVRDLTEGTQFGQLLEKLYETDQTSAYLEQVVANNSSRLDKLTAAIQGIDNLGAHYQQQIDLIDKALHAFQLVSLAAIVAMPQVKLFLAAVYVVTAAYVVLAGADYVDAQRLRLLDRLPGVRRIVEANLVGA